MEQPQWILFEPSNWEGRYFVANMFELRSKYDVTVIFNDYDMIMNSNHTSSIVVRDNFILLNLKHIKTIISTEKGVARDPTSENMEPLVVQQNEKENFVL